MNPNAPLDTALAIPTAADVVDMLNLLDGVRARLASCTKALTALQRRRTLRARKGGEATAALVAGLGAQYQVQIPGVDPRQIQRYALLAERLQPLQTRLRVLTGLVDDTVTTAKTESWLGTTALYTALARASKRDAVLQKEMMPAVAFFKKARASKSAAASAAKKQAGASAPPLASALPVTTRSHAYVSSGCQSSTLFPSQSLIQAKRP